MRVIWPDGVQISRVPAPQGINVDSRVGDVRSGAACGAVGAMAMTGMRVMTTELGLVEQTPPQALSRQRHVACAPCSGARRASTGGLSRPPTGRSALAVARHSAHYRARFGAVPGQDRFTGWSCGWASSWGSHPPWASARPGACA